MWCYGSEFVGTNSCLDCVGWRMRSRDSENTTRGGEAARRKMRREEEVDFGFPCGKVMIQDGRGERRSCFP